MESKKRIVFILTIGLCVVFITPFMLEIFIFRNNINSILSNGEWGGFLGSYIGGIVGGVGTLLAVYITTKETRKIQENTLEQIEKDRELNFRSERKKFADEISQNVAKYIAEISVYFYGCRTLERLNNHKKAAIDELYRIEQELQNLYNLAQENGDPSHIEVKINLLKQKEEMQKYKIENIEKDISIHRVNRIVANECLFLLQMKLQNLDEGKEIIKQLKEIHRNSADVENYELSWIDKATKDLQNMTVKFAEKFVEKNFFNSKQKPSAVASDWLSRPVLLRGAIFCVLSCDRTLILRG